MPDVAQIRISNYRDSVAAALDAIAADRVLPADRLILIKPNLTNSAPPPVTTPVGIVEAVYHYIREHCDAEIAVAEGCGSGTTRDVFDALGYSELAGRLGIRLIDFNTEPSVVSRRAEAKVFREMHLAGTPKRLNLILASLDPVAVDAVGSRLLGHDPHALEYLRLSEGVHGSMRDIREID